MLGHMVISEERTRALPQREGILGLSLLRCDVPAEESFWKRRRVRKAALALFRRGVRRVLTPEGFPHWAILEEAGLGRVDPVPLCQAMAAPLTIAALERRGIEPGSASVALAGSRVSRSFLLAAEELCLRVRSLIIAAPVGGRELAAYLRREYGVAVVEEGRPSLTLCFSSCGVPGELRLYSGGLWLDGMSIGVRSGRLPEEAERLPLLEALWEGGILTPGDLRVTQQGENPGQEGQICLTE